MKRLLIISLLLTMLIATPVVASDLDDAMYRGKVIISNSDTAATNVCVPFTLSTSNLISDGYLDSDCANSAMQINGLDVAYMPAPGATDDWIVFVETAPAGDKTSYLYTGGGDMSSKLCYFPDDAGMNTSDSPTLELGNNFIIEQSGFIDTADGADKNLARKDSAIEVYITDDEEITVKFNESSAVYTSPTGATANDWTDPGNAYDDNTTTFAQETESIPDTWTSWLELNHSAIYTNYVRFWINSSGYPTSITADVDAYYNGDWQDVYQETPTPYGQWVYADLGSMESVTSIRVRMKSGYVNVLHVYELDYGFYPMVTATGIETGEHKIEVIADGTDLSIEVDDVEEDSVALNGASVPDNGNTWYFLENQVMPYMEYHKITVSGVLQQYIIWENNASTFSDQSGNGHTVTPSFRTTSSDADVSAELVEFLPINQAQASGTADIGSSLNIEAPDEISVMYDEGDYSGVPGAEAVNVMLEDADVPLELFWYPTIFGVAIILGLIAYGLTKQMFVMGVSMTLALAVVSYNTNDGINITGGIIPFWTVIAAIILTVTAYVMQNREALT